MIRYFQKKYILDEESAKAFLRAIRNHTFANIANWLPLAYTFFFLEKAVGILLGELPANSLELWKFVIGAFVCLPLMYFIHYVDYGSLYVKIYEESAKKRISFAEKLKRLPLAFFDRKDLSDLSTTMMTDITTLETLYSHAIPQFYASLITIAIIALNLLLADWRMALSIIWVMPTAYLAYALTKRHQKKVMKESYTLNRSAVDILQESFDSIQEVKSYQSEKLFYERFSNKCDEIHRNMIRAEILLGSVNNFAFMILKLGLVSCAVTGTYLMGTGSLSPLYFIAFLLVSANIYNSVYEVLNNLAMLNMIDQTLERTREIEEMNIMTGESSFSPETYDISFEQVGFAYNEDVQILDQVTFTAKQGEITALVGPSGGGKSTISRLCARFWDATSGRVLLGGRDISQVDPEALLKHFAIVFQDVLLFDTSVLENIRLGRSDATEEEVMECARLAQCDSFVSKLPEGYHTRIGENGARLSGGERQRISIARAILKNAPVILLDEATASVDAENETRIQMALGELVKDKTVVIIAHRMRTILGVDKVVVVEHGRISEQGSPDELLKAGGTFSRLVRAQSETL